MAIVLPECGVRSRNIDKIAVRIYNFKKLLSKMLGGNNIIQLIDNQFVNVTQALKSFFGLLCGKYVSIAKIGKH